MKAKLRFLAPSAGVGEVAKRYNRVRDPLSFHDAQEVGPYRVSNQLRLTVVTAKSEDYTSALQNLQRRVRKSEWALFFEEKCSKEEY